MALYSVWHLVGLVGKENNRVFRRKARQRWYDQNPKSGGLVDLPSKL